VRNGFAWEAWLLIYVARVVRAKVRVGLEQYFPTFFGSRHPCLVKYQFCGTPSSILKIKLS